MTKEELGGWDLTWEEFVNDKAERPQECGPVQPSGRGVN